MYPNKKKGKTNSVDQVGKKQNNLTTKKQNALTSIYRPIILYQLIQSS